jgi:hypothetical protein
LNILQSPPEYRIDILPPEIKQEFQKQFEQHIEWLQSRDPMQRATGGFEGAVKFMLAQDRSELLPDFWETASDLDWSRNERIIAAVPELAQILQYKPSHTRV